MNSEPVQPVKMEIVNESQKNNSGVVDQDTLNLVFGTPNSTNKTNGSIIDNERNHTNATFGNQGNKDDIPLLERDKQKPPLADSETDELDAEVAKLEPYPDSIDGMLDNNNDRKTDIMGGDHSDGESKHDMPGDLDGHDEDGVVTEDGKWHWPEGDVTDYPYDNGLSPRFGEDGRPISPMPSVSGLTAIDVNTYQQKKNLAQGMMDLALLSANANQLRYVVESTNHPYFYFSLISISLSIIIQIAVGVGLIMNSRYDVNDKKEICKADRINNFTVLGIFLITIVNVFITSFSVATPPLPTAPPPSG